MKGLNNWVEVMGQCQTLAANRSGWKKNVKAFCALWHKVGGAGNYRSRF